MPNLYSLTIEKNESLNALSNGETTSLMYHDIFDFPLKISELIRWKAGESIGVEGRPVVYRNGYFFIEGKEGIIYKRLLRKRVSAKKLEIARKASSVISLVPSVLMVAVTGSLAMENASEESDIDLMIVTKKGTLWTTRLFVYMVTHAFGFATRKPNDSLQKDKLCLNMWLDESDLAWKESRNLYNAHEIAQVLPLVNKSGTYEKFLAENSWILKYWPRSVRIRKKEDRKIRRNKSFLSRLFSPIENVCFWLQRRYMKSRLTRETVTPTRALFHPQDWGEIVLTRLHALV